MPLTTTVAGTAVSTTTSEAVSSQIRPNLTSTITVVITETVAQLSRTRPVVVWGTGASDSSAESQAGATGTGSSSTGAQTAASSAGDSLTAGQIGGISAGVVVGFLLLVAMGWLLVRHLIRISRFMDKFNKNQREQIEKPPVPKGEDGTKDSELKILNDGNDRTGGNGQTPAELSPQERPQLLEEWGRHGSRGNELSGGQEAHGISELDGTGVSR